MLTSSLYPQEERNGSSSDAALILQLHVDPRKMDAPRAKGRRRRPGKAATLADIRSDKPHVWKLPEADHRACFELQA
jgi:hypothetical protein